MTAMNGANKTANEDVSSIGMSLKEMKNMQLPSLSFKLGSFAHLACRSQTDSLSFKVV